MTRIERPPLSFFRRLVFMDNPIPSPPKALFSAAMNLPCDLRCKSMCSS